MSEETAVDTGKAGAGTSGAAKSGAARWPLIAGAAAGGAGLSVVAVALWYGMARPPLDPPQAVVADAPSYATPDTVAMAVPAPEPDETADEAPQPPRFDTVRHSPDGGTIVAGSAAPGAEVSVIVDGAEVARATANSGGAFVAMFDLPPSSDPRVLTMAAGPEGDDPVMAGQSIIIAPRLAALEPADGAEDSAPLALMSADETSGPDTAEPEAPRLAEAAATEAPEPAAVDPSPEQIAATPAAGDAPPSAGAGDALATAPADPGSLTAAEAPATPAEDKAEAVELAADTSAAVPAPGDTMPGAAADPVAVADSGEAVAPALLMADDEGVRLLSDGPAPNVVIDTIGYDAAGEVQLAGRATGEGHVRLYLDNRETATLPVGPDGQWEGQLPDVASGLYTLRVDELSPEGQVVSRFETPFQRDEPEDLARLAAELETAAADGVAVQVVTVQPGYTLWGIARERYGRGIEYVRVYEANRDQIRNPHLIYPGQVFTFPEETTAE
ncbi:LysM peptidoglycan-binding domain-containing protein [Halodurantibacterium flavum]|uniref:LysM peptidoglycan-binding domain-containing protein n=1 Tax=Halodurantibacterium flavum TaxID=1382802 RepID=A0ABW4S420_9RHOB